MKKISFLLLLVLTLVFANIKIANAATTASISTNPENGTYNVGEEFDVGIVIDGGGQEFTSFGANVTTSNLTVLSLVKGPVTQWVLNPTNSSLNFNGAVAGTTNNITVYTLKVKANSAGTASIDISNGTVKSTDGFTVTEIIDSTNDGHYDINNPSDTTPSNTNQNEQTYTSENSQSTTIEIPSENGETETFEENESITEEVVVNNPIQDIEPQPNDTSSEPKISAPILPDNIKELQEAWSKYEVCQSTIAIGVDSNATKNKNDQLVGVKFYGKTSANTLISLFLPIGGNAIYQSAISDQNGFWQMVLNQPFKSDSYSAYFLFTNQENKSCRNGEKINFEIDSNNLTAKVTAEKPLSAEKAKKFLSPLYVSLMIALILTIIVVVFLIKKRKKQ